MKTKISYSLLAAAMACGLAQGQTTAYTTPVGYVTSFIGPNASGNSEGATTMISSSLVNPTVFAASASIAPTGSVVTFASGVPADLDSTYMLEITDGTQEGWWSAVSASNSSLNTITVNDALPASLPAGVKVSVRKFTTVQDVFGDNTPGLAPFSNTQPFDNIQILDPETQAATTIIYVGNRWEDAVSEEPAGSVIIYPGTAALVIHRANTTLPVVVSGTVKTTKTQVDIFPADNWLGQARATGGTFGQMALGTQLLPATDVAAVIGLDTGGGQSAPTFVRVGSQMENAVTEDPADNELISEGAGYILSRTAGAASIITIPAQTVAP